MANPFAGRDIAAIWRTVEQLARDETIAASDAEMEAVSWLRNMLGTRKPLQSYAPRTRRRYRAATREGITARETNQREYATRRGTSSPPSKEASSGGRRARATKRQRMLALIDQRNELLPQSPVDVDDVEEYVLAFGYDNVLTLLEHQVESCRYYARGSKEPGHTRWYTRAEVQPEKVRPDFSSYISNTDIMYYYHSVRS